jgi:hypothetical protein
MKKGDRLKQVANRQARAATGIDFSRRELVAFGLSSEEFDCEEVPHVSLRFYYPKYQCISSWTTEQLQAFSSFCSKITRVGWNQIYKTGGGLGHKTGFGYSKHSSVKALPKNPDLPDLSPDLTWFELRVDGTARVHGFRFKSAFFLVFLDKDHAICAM